MEYNGGDFVSLHVDILGCGRGTLLWKQGIEQSSCLCYLFNKRNTNEKNTK